MKKAHLQWAFFNGQGDVECAKPARREFGVFELPGVENDSFLAWMKPSAA